MSRKLNLYDGIPAGHGKEEGADGYRRLEKRKAAEQDKKAVAKAIQAAPKQVLTGQGVIDMSAQAALESGLQGPRAQDDATRLADLKKERDQLVALRADSPSGRDTQAMDNRISDLTTRIAVMGAQGCPRVLR